MSFITVGSITAGVPNLPVYTRKPSLASLATGLPEIALGIGFLITWVNPDRLGRDWVSLAMELMLLEFILIHSAGFMGVKSQSDESAGKRLAGVAGLGAFYSLFVLGFCLALHRWRPMISFWIVTTQRMAGGVLDPKPSEEARAWYWNSLAVNAMLYLGFVMVTVLVPIPEMGITGSVRAEVGIHGSGLWQAQPYRVVVLAGLYYVCRGLLTASARPRHASPPPPQNPNAIKLFKSR